jgi:hypothetical protein
MIAPFISNAIEVVWPESAWKITPGRICAAKTTPSNAVVRPLKVLFELQTRVVFVVRERSA